MMFKNIAALVLLGISMFFSFKHGWDTIHYKQNPATLKAMADLRISANVIPYFGFLALAIGVLLLIPKTFFLGNVLNAISIVLIMAFAIRAGNFRMLLIEIPFLILPMVMIWLKYPFKN